MNSGGKGAAMLWRTNVAHRMVKNNHGKENRDRTEVERGKGKERRTEKQHRPWHNPDQRPGQDYLIIC